MEKEYKSLKFTNDFMFAKVMQNKKLCKKLLGKKAALSGVWVG